VIISVQRGAAALSKISSWKNLTTLNLGGNNIGAEGSDSVEQEQLMDKSHNTRFRW